MRRYIFAACLLALAVLSVWALTDGGGLAAALALLSLIGAVFAAPSWPPGGDNWDVTFGGGGDGGGGA